jgi:hypothetical protein
LPIVVLTAIVAALLVLPVQASAASAVTGTIEALGATAQQQLAAVAQDTAAAVPLPQPSVPAVSVTKDVAPTVDAVPPQTVAKAVTDVASSANVGSERSGAGELAETARSGPSDANSRVTAAPVLAATERAERAPSGRPSPTDPTRILDVTREIVAAHAKPLARSLAHTTQALQRTPAARDLGRGASHIAGALRGTVAGVATVAHESILIMPIAGVPPLLQTPQASLTSMWPSGGSMTTSGVPLSPSAAQASPATDDGTIGSTVAATAPVPSAIGRPPLDSATSGSPLSPSMRVRTPMPEPGDTTHFAWPSGSSGPQATMPSAVAATGSPPVQMPGGSAPVSGAGAAGGLSGSALLAFAALLLLAAPLAMRRLRLAAGSWRAAQFILIPERPG